MIIQKQINNIGISFLGGGTRAVAYAGLLKAFEEKGIKINALVGSSGGACVAAAYAFNKSPEQIKESFKTFKPGSLYNPISIFRKGNFNYSSWIKHFAKLIPIDYRIENSNKKLAIHLTNLETLESEFKEAGPVVETVVASSAFVGGYTLNGTKFIDGDYDPETGVDFLKKSGCDFTILCYLDLGSKPLLKFTPFNITQKNAINLDFKMHPTDSVLAIKIDNPGSIVGTKNVDEHFNQGYVAGLKFLEEVGLQG